MSEDKGLLVGLQELVTQRLKEDPFFMGPKLIPIINEIEADLENTILQNLGKLGLCGIVITPKLLPTNKRTRVSVEVAIGFIEETIINKKGTDGARKSASECAEHAFGALMFSDPTLTTAWIPSDQWSSFELVRFGRVIRNSEGSKLLNEYELILRTYTTIGAQPQPEETT